MKKKYYLLFILCLMIIPYIRVEADDWIKTSQGKCGYVATNDSKTINYYEYSKGYCGPGRWTLGLSEDDEHTEEYFYNKFVGIQYDNGYFSYIFENSKNNGNTNGCTDSSYVPIQAIKSINKTYYCIVIKREAKNKENFKIASVKSTCFKIGNTINYKNLNVGDGYYYNSEDLGHSLTPVEDFYCKGCSSAYLKLGCTGEDVRNLQVRLERVMEEEGYVLDQEEKDSETYGVTTEELVSLFQKKYVTDAKYSGVADVGTLIVLDEAYQQYINELESNMNDTYLGPIINTGTTIDDKKSLAESNQTRYYTITYNTDGGHFINGETTRKVFVSQYESIISPIMPGKEGYKFLGWYNGSSKYEFGKTVSSDIALTAKWGKVETTLYCLNDNDVLDVDNGLCLTAESFDASDTNITEDKFYVPSGGTTLQTIQTRSKFNAYCNDNYVVALEKRIDQDGAANTVSCSEGYAKEYWRSADIPSKWNNDNYSNQCLVGSYCGDGTYATTCSRIWRGNCYKSYAAKGAALIDSDDDDIDEEDKDTTGGKPSQEDVEETPPTGNALILVAWTIGLGALGYSIYWFQKRREEL